MSRIALLICAKASLITEGPTVYVPEGYWFASEDRVVDTEYAILTSKSSNTGYEEYNTHYDNKTTKLISGKQFARVLIKKAGTEPFINIYLARKV